ncbi:MAG: archaellin/type IV pilin N-terminal domain-containing protein [Nitrososphaerales archaeon]
MDRDFHRKDAKRSKKGVSPVVATVILVAVAVTISSALAGFSSSIYGTYSNSEAVSIRAMSVDLGGDGMLEVVNTGGSSDSVASIYVPGGGRTPIESLGAYGRIYLDTSGNCGAAGTSPEVKANSEATICFLGLNNGGGDDSFTAGQQLSVRIEMKSGAELPYNVIVEPSSSSGWGAGGDDDDD